MRPLSRIAALGAATAFVAAPNAFAANTATATVSPNKGGTVTVAAPVAFKVDATFPDTPSDPSGNLRLQALQAKLPLPLLFNTIPFSTCNTATFTATKSCPSATKIGEATLVADGGPSVGNITATTTLYIGSGFSVLANVKTDKPAILNEAVVGRLQSSGTAGYGLELFIPVPQILQQPIDGLFPTVKSVSANFRPPSKSIKVDGKKVKLPLAGLGPCPSNKKLPFLVNVLYTDSGNVNTTKLDSASASAACKR